MHKNIYILFILIIIFSACKKEDGTDNPVLPSFFILHPGDSSLVQIGELVKIETEITGFGEDARVSFSVDNSQLSEDLEEPFNFYWDTETWAEGSYTIRADAYEPGTLITDKITIILIDTIIPPQAPVAIISISPQTGNTDSIYSFDASGSYDYEDDIEDLLFRWDFDGDGSWDTEFSGDEIFLHKYSHPNNYEVRMEVMDTDGMMSDTLDNLLVLHSGVQGACQGFVSLPHGGQVYHTVSIGEQCWLRENLNIGLMINDSIGMTDNDTIEKYCYDNDTANCDKNGGLYQWHEMMEYFPLQGAQGICPQGWHIPTDEDWKELEAFVDTEYDIYDPIWDETMFRGFDAGKNLKSLLGWHEGGNGNNLHDFKALPAGFWEQGANFSSEGMEAHFWSSAHDVGANGLKRMLSYDEDKIYRSYHWDESAISIRCIKD